MKENIKSILPGIGLGDLIFGMKRDQVKVVLGEPDEIETQNCSEDEEEDIDSIEIWHYDELELSISFSEEEDWRLYTISVNADFYQFHNESIINMDKKKVKAKLQAWDITDLEFEDLSSAENPDHKLISSEEIGVYFWFEDGDLSEIQWSPLFKDEDTIVWPEIPS